MTRFNTITVLILVLMVTAPCLLNAQEPTLQPRSIGVNPVGMVLNGLSFVEFTYPLAPQFSMVARLDYIRYSEEETEHEGYNDVYNNEYTEKGSGPGAGFGVRYFAPLSTSVNFTVSSGIDILMVNWEWNEYQYGRDGSLSYRPDSGDGTTTAFAFHGGFGLKIMPGKSKTFFIEPQALFGTLSLNVEKDNGTVTGNGFFFGGAVVLGVNL